MASEHHVPKTRRGGTLNNAENVKLHSNDFEWREKWELLSVSDKDLVTQYLSICSSHLNNVGAASTDDRTQEETNSWEKHYTCSRHHFPVKNYIIHAFPILKDLIAVGSQSHILEAGCGSGSTLLPLMKECASDKVTFVGFDPSKTAIEYFSEHDISQTLIKSNRLHLFVFGAGTKKQDSPVPTKRFRAEGFTEALRDSMEASIPRLSGVRYDAVLLIFVLSALPRVEDMVTALRQIASVMQPDGKLLFRDYALPDHNFFRYLSKSGGEVTSPFFTKFDGTTQFFFERDFVKKLFSLAGLQEVADEEPSLTYHCNRIVNRKNGKQMDKVFLNGVFRLSN